MKKKKMREQLVFGTNVQNSNKIPENLEKMPDICMFCAAGPFPEPPKNRSNGNYSLLISLHNFPERQRSGERKRYRKEDKKRKKVRKKRKKEEGRK